MKKLIILSGEEMFNRIKKDSINVYVPCNEAMCKGEVSNIIFNDDFIKNRIKSLNTTYLEYEEKVLNKFKIIKNNLDLPIELWFDEDMFCQMNILFVIQFLIINNYNKTIKLKILNNDFKTIDEYNIKINDFINVFNEVLVNKRQTLVNIKIIQEGINEYLKK